MSTLVRSRRHPVLGAVVFSSLSCPGLLAQAPLDQSIAKEPASPVIVPAHARQGDQAAQRLPDGLQRRALSASGAQVVEQDGELWGVGDRYKARFTAQGFEFIPQLGPRAPHNYPLEFRLQSVGRGEDRLPVETVAPRHEGLRVVYARGGVTERYDVRPEGIEQSFVFDRLPAGQGDLVVRGALVTGLVATPDGQGYRFELPGVGGLHFGGVTGIDAAGNRAAGRVAIVDGAIELSLPARFVADAALPLVLDPLVGSVFNAFSIDLDDRHPNVAYDLTNDVFLVVYERIFSATDTDIHGQRVSGAGALVGLRVLIDNTSTNDVRPRVANVNLRDRFVVVFERSRDIKGRLVNAATGVVLPEFNVASGTDSQIDPDIGGEATTDDDDAICVWENTTQSRIEACQISVAANDAVTVFDLTTIYASSTIPPAYPRISKCGGSTGNHCIAFELTYSPTDTDPVTCIVDRELTILDALRTLNAAVTRQVRPSVDGDGRQWVVAWQQEEATPNRWDIHCRAVSWHPAAGGTVQGRLLSGIVAVTAVPNHNEYTASVVWTGGSVLVGWTDLNGSELYCYFRSLDPFTCVACEVGQFRLDGSLPLDYGFTGCSKYSGGGSERQALLVIETNTGTTTGNSSNIEAQLWRSDDGLRTTLGSPCGADAGDIYASCARRGNAGFTVRLMSRLHLRTAVLVVSRDRFDLWCGLPCRLWPNPYSGFTHFATTDFSGQATFAAAIPNSTAVTGIQFLAQWLVADPATPGCLLFGADMTRAIALTID